MHADLYLKTITVTFTNQLFDLKSTVAQHSCYLTKNTLLMAHCLELPRWAGTRKVKPICIYWSKSQWVALASAGPYANLHLKQTDNHASTPPLSSYKPDALPAAEATVSKHGRQSYYLTNTKYFILLVCDTLHPPFSIIVVKYSQIQNFPHSKMTIPHSAQKTNQNCTSKTTAIF